MEVIQFAQSTSIPKVSICIPSYKKPDLLRRCLDSVFNQSFVDLEIIVLDDSPDQDNELVVHEFSNRGLPIFYRRNSPALGTPANWNAAIDRARGQYVHVLHHDDWYGGQDSLASLIGTLDSDANMAMVVALSESFDPTGRLVGWNLPSAKFVFEVNQDSRLLLWGNYIGAPSAVIFRNPGTLRFNPDYSWLVDIEFYIRFLQTGRGYLGVCPHARIGIGIESGRVTNYFLMSSILVVKETLRLVRYLQLGSFYPKISDVFSRPEIRPIPISALKLQDWRMWLPIAISSFRLFIAKVACWIRKFFLRVRKLLFAK